MYFVAAIDIVSTILLINAFYVLWKEKNRFYSIKPLLPSVAFLCVGRICDIVIEHPSISPYNVFGLSSESFELVVSLIGNVSDVAGISLLIYGFIRIIKYQAETEKQIHDMETLLPICCNCKKYRTEDNQWLPIEQFLAKKGAPTSHGICPECMTALYGSELEGN